MAARAIATLSLSFGLVSIPVKLYSATDTSTSVRFKLMGRGGAVVRQQYVADEDVEDTGSIEPVEAGSGLQRSDTGSGLQRSVAGSGLHHTPAEPAVTEGGLPRSTRPDPVTERFRPDPVTEAFRPDPIAERAVVERGDLVKGYEFERGKFVLFTPRELKALREASREAIDIVAFIPQGAVDPIYYDKAYYLAPDRRGERPYSLLLEAMRRTGRAALAKWAWRSKEMVVQIRPAEGGMVLQQLRYADEVRSLAALDVPLVDVSEPEVALAVKLIDQIAEDAYDPARFVDEEKLRILAAVDAKIAGREIVAPGPAPSAAGAQVIDLMEALRASLAPAKAEPARKAARASRAAPAKPRARKSST
jgi:DNA end-binding protein Ku